MTPMQRKLKKQMLRRVRETITECEQMIRDALYWNSINPTERPIDVERERVAVKLLRDFKKELLANNGERLDDAGRLQRVIATLDSPDP